MTSEGPEPESNRLPAAMFHGFFATECRCGPPLQVLFSLEINCHMLSKIYRQFKKKSGRKETSRTQAQIKQASCCNKFPLIEL
jgi:hypothetical protein